MIQYLPCRLDLIKRLPPGSDIAEVGVLWGDFSKEILTTPVAHLYLVDPWRKLPGYTDTWNDFPLEACLARVHRDLAPQLASGRVEIHRGTSADIAAYDKTIPPLDAVFIDGNHLKEFVLEDLLLWEKRLKPTGILMGHDYIRHTDFGVIEACETFCKERPWEIEFLTKETDWPSYQLKRR